MNNDSFIEYFKDFCLNSYVRLANEHRQTDPEYKQLTDKCSALLKEVGERLGGEKHLLNNLEEALLESSGYDDPYIYQQGFQDCIYLLRWMGAI